jgi:hypothetical protein
MKVSLKIKKYYEVNFFFKNLLVPIAIMTLYCGSYAYFSSRLLPEGVNYAFVSRLWKYLLILLAIICAITFVLIVSKKNSRLTFTKTTQNVRFSDLFFLLIPLTPVVQYLIINQSILSFFDSLFVLILFTVFSSICIFAIPSLLGIIGSTRILMILGLAFVVTIISMAMLSQYFYWFEEGSLKIQLGYFCFVFIASWLLFCLKNRKVLYFLLFFYFIANCSIQLLSKDNRVYEPSSTIEKNKMLSIIEDRIPAITPNIYLLVYDSYVSNETMLAYGIENNLQEDYLNRQGFVIYPHTYSVGYGTLESMSKVLDMSNNHYGNIRTAISGDGIVQNTFKYLGYKTYGLFPTDYMFRNIGSSYDVSFPEGREQEQSSYALLVSAIFLGEFRFDQGFNTQTYEQFLITKQSVFKDVSEKKVFIYMHSNLPGQSQNSGSCLVNETELFKERLLLANVEMRQDIKLITEYDSNAIIIIAGDHGPSLTKNCRSINGEYDISEISRVDIQDRIGTFLAIRWPTKEYVKFDEITVVQDLFPSIFAYIYNDPELLKLKVNPEFLDTYVVSGVLVKNGIIFGGINDGELLFLSGK